jgi:shikimate dehydrogenase
MRSIRCAVIGNPIAHSLSPMIHDYFAKEASISLVYQKILGCHHDFERQTMDFFLQEGKGLNVTLPFKQRAFALAQQASEACQSSSAANTLWMKEGLLYADNTDGIGFIRDLVRFVAIQGKRVLILGAGGAARGILAPLLEKKPQSLILANRHGEKAKTLAMDFHGIQWTSFEHLAYEVDLIINATSAHLTGDSLTLPKDIFVNKPFCYDLSYQRSADTAFVKQAKKAGCNAADGMGMLVEQAAESFYLWHGIRPTTTSVLELLRSSYPSRGRETRF